MRRLFRSLILPSVACALVVSLGLIAWAAIGANSSDAQAGAMHNCPPAAKWSIAVWDGPETAPDFAFAACGEGAVAAAYSLDPQTGAWSRWFAGKPDVSNLAALSDLQGVLALGSAIGPAPTPTVTATATATAPAGAPQSGTYIGTTSQGNPIEFDVAADNQTITRIKFLAGGTCGEGCTCQGDVTTNFGVTPPTIVNNAFSHTAADYDISGMFDTTTTASGSLEYHHNGIAPDVDCNSGPLTWQASLQ